MSKKFEAFVRTGSGPLLVTVKVKTKGGFKIKVKDRTPAVFFESIKVVRSEASSFLETYTYKRNLELVHNLPGYEGSLALINPRHDSIRRITPDNKGRIDLLEFIEPEFITVNPLY